MLLVRFNVEVTMARIATGHNDRPEGRVGKLLEKVEEDWCCGGRNVFDVEKYFTRLWESAFSVPVCQLA